MGMQVSFTPNQLNVGPARFDGSRHWVQRTSGLERQFC